MFCRTKHGVDRVAKQLVGAGVKREINYLARESLFRFPVVGAVLRAVNCVPVDREGGGASFRVLLPYDLALSAAS